MIFSNILSIFLAISSISTAYGSIYVKKIFQINKIKFLIDFYNNDDAFCLYY